MSTEEIKDIKFSLIEKFKVNFQDISCVVDFTKKSGMMDITFFWDQVSQKTWRNIKTFTMKGANYGKVLKTKINPFFSEQVKKKGRHWKLRPE